MNEFNSRNQGSWQPPQQGGAWGSFGAEAAARAGVEERMGFVRKVYALFFAATLFAIVGVGLGFAFPSLMLAVARHPWLTFFAIVGGRLCFAFPSLMLPVAPPPWLTFFALMGGVMGAQAVRLVPGVNL